MYKYCCDRRNVHVNHQFYVNHDRGNKDMSLFFQQVSVDKNSPVKLSYAQMVQRGRDSDSAAESKNNSDSDSESVQQNTLKEQSQAKTSTAKKDQSGPQKDSELPKEQRHFSGRCAKENRERRDRRRSERETSRSSTK